METKTKNRGWVKNAAIIFLSIMLVLTFFSNTIMNRSLPQVATQYISSGSITAKIRGTGTVTANSTYDVVLNQSRTVKTVMVKQGQEVRTGDVLFVLADTESQELASAQETLRALNKQYQIALINASSTDYARENREIQKARTALEEAEAERDELYITEDDVALAKANVEMAAGDVAYAQRKVDKAQQELDEIGALIEPDSDTVRGLKKNMEEKKAEITDAENALATARLIYGEDYDALEAEAAKQIKETEEYNDLKSDSAREKYVSEMLPVYMPFVISQINDQLAAEAEATGERVKENIYETAFDNISACVEAVEAKQKEYDALSEQYKLLVRQDNSELYNEYSENLRRVQTKLETAQEIKAAADEELARLQEQMTSYKNALKSVESCQEILEDLVFSLQQQQKSDNKSAQLENLEMQDLLNQIADQKAYIEELNTDSTEKEIKSDVNGVVQSVNITAGNTTSAGSPVCTIEIPDMGYSMSFSVTNEQARRVHTGDSATVSNYYYGSSITATLAGIKTDPQNPQNQKLLVFDVSGDVSVGANLTISVGQKSAEYDYVVPNSAIRSDSNGSFVYIITAKNSPLGNRYIATRADVTVIASDDTNTAITGGIESYDYVITTSNKPIENGDMVRMPD